MRITRIDIQGEHSQRFATITRNYTQPEIVVEIHKPEGTTKFHCDGDLRRDGKDDIAKAGVRLQQELDGYVGCKGDQVEYIQLIERFAD